MQVKELMSGNVIAVSPEETAAVASRMLARHNIGALPVCGAGGRLLGMVTDRDIVMRCVAADRDASQTPVREIMTNRVVSVTPEDDAEQAAALMAREQVRRLPVTERGQLVGLLSLGDLSVNRTMQMEASACLAEISCNIRRR